MVYRVEVSGEHRRQKTPERLAMASALGRAAMVGMKGIPAAGASRRVAVSGAAKRGFKTNPHVEVSEENGLIGNYYLG